MAETKRKRKTFTTPPGIASYPRVNGEPDTKFDDDGVWSVKLAFKSVKEPGVQAMLDRLQAAVDQAEKAAKADKEYVAALKKRGKKPFQADLPFVVDDETGEVRVTFKMKASGTSKKTNKKWEMRPAVFGKDGKPLPADAKIGSGTLMKVAYSLDIDEDGNPQGFYTAIGYGVSVRLEAVQVIELVEWGRGNAESYGFEVAESPDDDAADAPDDDDDETEDGEGGTEDDF